MIEKANKNLSYVTSGCIRTPDGALALRLKTILLGLIEVMQTHQPQEVALEQVFVNINPQSTLQLGQARGAAICAAIMENIMLSEYTALQIKQAVVGQGHANKTQVQEMVKRLLNLDGLPQADGADALACAICHAHASQGLGTLSLRGYRMKRGRLISL